jgi:hypothetical protein
MVKDVGTLAVYLTMPRDDFNKGLQEAQKGIGQLSKSIAGFAVGAAAGITAFATASVHKFMESEAAAKQLDQTLKSTKFAAGFNSEQLKSFSNEMKSVSVYGGTAITRAIALMATFTSIKGDIFKKAIESAMDLNSALGGDIQGNVIQLGKALNNPLTGMTALRRVGVSFTKEQEAAVESLVNAGKLEEAQMIILNELQVEFGGQARAMSQTAQGAYLKMQNAMGGVNKEIGQMIVEGLGLVDVMNRKSESMNYVTKTLKNMDDATRNAVVRSTALALAVGSLVGAYKAFVWTGLVQGISALGKYVYLCATHTTASSLNTAALWKEVQAQNALNISRAASLSSAGMGAIGKGVQTIGRVNLATGSVSLASEMAVTSKNSMPFFDAMKTLPALTFAASGAMAAIASSAAIAGTAIIGWNIGKFLGELLGLEDRFAKLIFGIDGIKNKSDELDKQVEAAWGTKGNRKFSGGGISEAKDRENAKIDAQAKYNEEMQKGLGFNAELALTERKLQDDVNVSMMARETLEDKLNIIAYERNAILRESMNVMESTGDAAKDLLAEEKRLQGLREQDMKKQIEKMNLIKEEEKRIKDSNQSLNDKKNELKFKNAVTLEEKLGILKKRQIDAELMAVYGKDEVERNKANEMVMDIEQQMKELKKEADQANKYVAPRLSGAVEKGTVEAYRAELAGTNGVDESIVKTAVSTERTAKGVDKLVYSMAMFGKNFGVA